MTVNRVTPTLPVTAMQTFSVSTDSARHWRRATCAQVNCRHWREGWLSAFDESAPDQHGLAQYVRNFSGRRFTERRDDQGRTVFRFHPGQVCFNADQHRVRDEDVPELYLARAGDWRGNPDGKVTRHSGVDPWLDHMQANLERVAARLDVGE